MSSCSPGMAVVATALVVVVGYCYHKTTLPTWRHAEALLRDVAFLVLPRPGYEDEGGGTDARPARLCWVRPPLGGGTSLAPSSLASSTEARARLGAGASVLGLVPAPVVAFIAASALYALK